MSRSFPEFFNLLVLDIPNEICGGRKLDLLNETNYYLL